VIADEVGEVAGAATGFGIGNVIGNTVGSGWATRPGGRQRTDIIVGDDRREQMDTLL
jgi:hypothetical protein